MGCVHSEEAQFDPIQKNNSGVNINKDSLPENNIEIGKKKTQNGETVVAPVVLVNSTKPDTSRNHVKNSSAPNSPAKNKKKESSLKTSKSEENLAGYSDGKKKKKRFESFFPQWRLPHKCKQCTRSSNCLNEQVINSPSYTHCCKCCAAEKTKRGLSSPNMNKKKSSSAASLANILALAALDLSAPASDALIRNRKNAWIQLAGHPGAFAPAGPNTIWKKRISKDNYELKAYESFKEDVAWDIVPYFHREVEFNGEYFIEMEDLLQHFNDPYIMDIKMGRRTYLESEVENPVLRKDLFEKMVNMDPDAPTESEKEAAAISKLRYMQFREKQSSSDSLGFRIDGIRMSGQQPNTNLKKVKSVDQIVETMQSFIKTHQTVQDKFLTRLREIRDKFERSSFLMSHEIIGSSLLLMYDKDNNCGAWMIDFAKTLPVEKQLTHRSPWIPGNHEDGYLFGLDNIIQIFEENDLSVKVNQDDNDSCSNDIR